MNCLDNITYITSKKLRTLIACHTYCLSYNVWFVIHKCDKLSLQQVSLRNCRIYYMILICIIGAVFVSYTNNKPFVGEILLCHLLHYYRNFYDTRNKLLQQPQESLGRRTPGLYKRRSPGLYKRRTPGLYKRRTPGLYKRRTPGLYKRRSPGLYKRRIPGLYKPERFKFMWSLCADSKIVYV